MLLCSCSASKTLDYGAAQLPRPNPAALSSSARAAARCPAATAGEARHTVDLPPQGTAAARESALRLLRCGSSLCGATPAALVAAARSCGWVRFWTVSSPGHCPALASPSAHCRGFWLRPLLRAPARSDMDDEEGPSPNAYNITTEIIDTVERKAPSYSFGVTHSPTKFISEAHEAVKFGQVRAPPPLCLSCTLSSAAGRARRAPARTTL